MTYELDHPTMAMAMQTPIEADKSPNNIDAFRAANLKVVALILKGSDPRGLKVEEANAHAEDVFAGRNHH